ncbi:MAG: hypothetical protein NVSMB12_17060 [Acidimicrobiales bacterium]
MTTATRRIALFAAATTTLAVTACSSPLPSSSGAQPAPVTTTTIVGHQTPAQTKGADLRAQLTGLLVEHAYLVGRVTKQIATATGAEPAATTTTVAPAATTTTTGAPTTGAPPTTAVTPPAAVAPVALPALGDAATVLDKNSHDLADAVSAAYSGDFNAQFYALWTKRITAFETYARGKATGSGPVAATASDELTAVDTELATLFHTANKYIEIHTVASPGTGLRDELEPDNTAMTDLIDAQVKNDATQTAKQVAAAEKLPHTAEVLAAAAAKLAPETYPGTVTGTAANLRASLTTVLVEHVELAAIALSDVVAGRDAGPAAAVLDANGRQLANVFAAAYTDQAAATFLAQWRSHIALFVDYAKAKAAGDPAAASAAAAKLDDYSSAVGAFLAQATNGKLSAPAVAAEFRTHIAGVLAAVDGAATRNPAETQLISAAAAHMTDTASTIAEAIAEQYPAKFLP